MLIDGHGRVVDYLRVSLTERCNFRCQYCMPEKPFSWVSHEDILTYEELFLFIKVAIDEGVKKIRLTGGEPLVRPHIDVLIKMISDYDKSVDLAITSNAYLLEDMAQKLYDVGLRRVNLSLDSLKADVFQKISKIDALPKVLKGIEKAREVGLGVKINMVPLQGINDTEILDVFEYAKEKNMTIRFIEFMENSFAKDTLKGLNKYDIKKIIATKYNFESIGKDGASPASRYQLDDGYIFGIIDPHKHDFCENCNRIRLDAKGMLIPCLYFDQALSIKESLKKGNIKEASEILRTVLKNKPEKNRWNGDESETSSRAFYHTGG